MAANTAEFSAVRAAVRAYAAGCKFVMRAPDMQHDIAQDLHLDNRMRQSESSRLVAQIRRALNEMAAAGELVKKSDGSSAEYLTPAAAEWHRAEKARREAEAEEDHRRRRDLHARLTKLGVTGGRFVNDGIGIARVDLSLLESLVALAEAATPAVPAEPEDEDRSEWPLAGFGVQAEIRPGSDRQELADFMEKVLRARLVTFGIRHVEVLPERDM